MKGRDKDMKKLLTQEEVLQLLRQELPYLREKYGVEQIAVFGSFAKECIYGRLQDNETLPENRR